MIKFFGITIRLLLVLILSGAALNSQNLNDIYQTLPDVQSCKPGVLKQSEIDKVIQLTNRIRLLHKLPLLQYEMSTQTASMEGCLNIVASGESGHIDNPSSDCYTPDGGKARMKSNLYGGRSGSAYSFYSEDVIIGWMWDDKNADVAGRYKVGHRRAIINPFLKSFSFGRAEGYKKSGGEYWVASNFHYQDYVTGAANVNVDFVAYPYENYPINYFKKDFYLSFMAIIDKSNLWNNQAVDFSQVQITMTAEGGGSVNVHDVQGNNEGWGSYPNNVSWMADGLQNEVKYLVEVKNVKFNNQTKNYSYWFRLTNVNHNVKPATPALISPENYAENVKINGSISWEAVQNAASYQFQLAENKNMNNPIIDKSNLVASAYTPTELTYGKTYYWRVKAANDAGQSEWSEVWQFTTSAPKPNAPALAEPADKATINTISPKLTWNKIPGAETYMVQVSKDAGFTGFNVRFSKSNITDNFIEIPSGPLETNTLYYWRVQAKNGSGNSDWSNVWSFNTGVALPAPQLLNPSDKATKISVKPLIQWKEISGATSYQLQLNDSPELDVEFVIYEMDWKTTEYQVGDGILKADKTYYWHVRGKNANGFGDWSPTFSFTTEPGTGIDDEYISQIIYPNPANDVIIIKSPGINPTDIEIYNMNGNLILTQTVNQPVHQINVNSLAVGSYLVRIISNGTYYNRIINIIR